MQGCISCKHAQCMYHEDPGSGRMVVFCHKKGENTPEVYSGCPVYERMANLVSKGDPLNDYLNGVCEQVFSDRAAFLSSAKELESEIE